MSKEFSEQKPVHEELSEHKAVSKELLEHKAVPGEFSKHTSVPNELLSEHNLGPGELSEQNYRAVVTSVSDDDKELSDNRDRFVGLVNKNNKNNFIGGR